MSKFSLVIITKNEQAHIERCIRSVPFADDIVVLDSGSTDATCETARALGARVFQEPWRGFGAQKQRAVELAAHDWVLSLDADEALSPGLQQELRQLLPRLEGERSDGLEMPRLSFHLGRWIGHGGWYPDWQLRMFDRRRAHWSKSPIHERVEARHTRRLAPAIEHFVFSSLSDQVQTNDRYSSLMAQQLLDRGKKFSCLLLLTKPWSKFFETYVWKRGFMDGMPGFVIAVGAAYSVFLKWAKLWELEQKKLKL